MSKADSERNSEELARMLERMSNEARYRLFCDFVSDYPLNAWGWFRVAYAAEDLRLFSRARKCYEISISLSADNEKRDSAYFNLALLLESHFQDYINARLNYLNTIAVNPSHAGVYNNLGLLLYRHFEEDDLAKGYYLQGLRNNSDDSTLHYNLGYLYSVAYNDNESALQHFRTALAINPNDEDLKHDIDVIERGLI